MTSNEQMQSDEASTRLTETLGEQWRDGLESVLAAQLEQYGSLDAISERQRACIESGDTDRLMGLLGERSGLIESIAESSKRFAPFIGAWAEIEQALPEDAWEDLRRRLEAIASIAEAVATRDAEDTELIQQNRDLIAEKLSGVTKSTAAAKAYAGPRVSGARYQDREA